MSKRPQTRPETVGFTLSASIPVEKIGYILKAMFDNGCPPDDLKALFSDQPIPAMNGHIPALIEQATVPQLEAPKKRTRGPVPRQAPVPSSEVRSAFLRYMKERHPEPVTRQELHGALRTMLGPNLITASIDNVVLHYVKSDWVERPDIGVMKLRPRALRADEPPPPPPPLTEKTLTGDYVTCNQFTLGLFQANPARVWELQELRDAFAKDGRKVINLKTSVQVLSNKGNIKRVSLGRYTLA